MQCSRFLLDRTRISFLSNFACVQATAALRGCRLMTVAVPQVMAFALVSDCVQFNARIRLAMDGAMSFRGITLAPAIASLSAPGPVRILA